MFVGQIWVCGVDCGIFHSFLRDVNQVFVEKILFLSYVEDFALLYVRGPYAAEGV
jgi:hypothetical protein